MKGRSMKIAVVTGASSGMGREFVTALDNNYKYDEIWVIARRKERLEELKTRASLRAFALDLTDPESFEVYQRALEEVKPDIRTLVNGAGYGKFLPYDQMQEKDIAGIIDLNLKALILMTHLSLPHMHEGGEIYNMGSMSSFQPTPFMLNYASTKAGVVSYSRGLNVELRPRKIKVMAVCPGWVETEFFGVARAENKTDVNYFNVVYKPDAIIRTALRDMKKGKDLSIHGLPVKAQALAVKLLPHKLVMNTWMKQQGHK